MGGTTCNFDKRWNPKKLGETLLLLLLGIDIDIVAQQEFFKSSSVHNAEKEKEGK
jgi:hypothetical protein